MLQTSAIKTDQAASSQAVKDKDPTAGANGLDADFTSYFSQMMAALPGLQPQLPASALPAPAPPQRTDPARKAAQNGSTGPQAGAAAGDTSQAASMAGAAAVSSQAPASAGNAQSGTPSSAPSGSRSSAGSAAQANAPAQSGGQAGAAQAGSAQGSADPKPAAQDRSAQPAGGGTQADPAAPSATAQAAGAADSQAAARAIAQAFPGGKFQVQYGETAGTGAPAATSKQPLTEFLSQSAVDPKATPQDSTLPAGTVAQNLAQTLGQAFTQSVPAAGLAGLQAVAGLQSPLVATSAQQASGQVTGVQTAGSGVTLAGNLASSQLGAAALPGATGAVRVTAAGSARNALPSAQEDVLSQVDGSIRWLVKNQDKSAELQLHPESLGRVQVKLTVEGNVVHAKLWASEASAVPLLQEHRGYLEESLKQQGLSLGSFDLQQGRRQEQAPLPTPSEPSLAISSSAVAGLSGQDSPVAVAVASVNAGRVEFVA